MTVYLGDALPTFYIGSSTEERRAEGYHGSVCSKKYKATWQRELKRAPELFETTQLDTYETRKEALEAEEALQRLFNAVKSEAFMNMAYARGGFYNAGPGYFSDETRAKMDVSAKLRGQPKPHAKPKWQRLTEEEKKRRAREKRHAKAALKRSLQPPKPPKPIKPPPVHMSKEEKGANISAGRKAHPMCDESRAKIGANTTKCLTGRKQSPDHIAKRAASRKRTMETRAQEKGK